MTVFVIAGGLSHEREVSLRSGKRLAGALRKKGHTVAETDVNADLIPRLLGDEDPVAIPVLHGGLGEDGALREVLWTLGVPFVGSDSASSRRTFDKSVATRLVGDAGLATPQQVALPDDVFRELGAQALMSALGATKVNSADDLPAALVGAFAYGKDAVVEEFVEGTELSVTVIEDDTGLRALPPVEIRPASGVYDYESRYTAGATRFLTPGELPDDVLEAAGDLAVRTHRVLGHRDLSRIDMIVRDGVPVFLESNVAPGLTDTSLTPLALDAAGLGMGEVFSALVEQARRRGH